MGIPSPPPPSPPSPQVLTREIALHQAQDDFCRSPSLYRGFVGGRGAGKSWVGAFDLLCRARPGRTYLAASPTYTLLEDTTLPTVIKIARELGVYSAKRASPRPNVTLNNGAIIRFRSAEDPDKMRGPNLSGVWLDEASLMHLDAYKIAIASLREAGEQGWLSATFTPKGLSHWTYEVFGTGRQDTEIFHARTRDNPFNPPAFHDTLAGQYEGLFAEQELEGRFVNIEGAEWPPEYFAPHIWADADQFPLPQRYVRSALALDPAQGRGEKGRHSPKGQGKKPCFASYVFVGIDAEATIWVDAWMSQGWDATALVDQGLALCKELGPSGFSVEKNGGQAFLLPLFIQAAAKKKMLLPLYGVNNTVQKETRIREVGPYLAQKKMRFRAGSPGAKLLVQQLKEFPAGQYVDGPDALQQAVNLLRYLLGHRGGAAEPEAARG